jgi:hypothetical protein
MGDAGMGAPGTRRVVALGASNLTRGFQTVVATAGAEWGSGVEVLAALGHGRSYGADSRLLVRRLPGILHSGLWKQLDSLPEAPTRALITDVGNDILYGFSVDQILEWVEQAIGRLERRTRDIVLTDLPLVSIRRLSRAKFLIMRSVLVPACRLSLAAVVDSAERVNEGLERIARAHGLRHFRMKPDWYGLDPIHIRPSLWRPAWQEILGCTAAAPSARASLDALRLYLAAPERRWLCGVEQYTPQTGTPWRGGVRIWTY